MDGGMHKMRQSARQLNTDGLMHDVNSHTKSHSKHKGSESKEGESFRYESKKSLYSEQNSGIKQSGQNSRIQQSSAIIIENRHSLAALHEQNAS